MRDRLREAGIEEFLPTREETSRWTDRIAKVTRPLFSGYIFIRCVPADVLQVLQTRGVVQILGVREPEPIADDVIAATRRAVEHSGALSACPYAAGESVTVKSGPFAGVMGVVSRVRVGPYDTATLTIPVAILGRAVSVQIAAADVE